ncbi:MAG: T9SS type A sorting domain-containing protein [Bacteroidetes bacterium]|nr:T9SS type A sorting domain-containing protein [Bacteroidota bacterium]
MKKIIISFLLMLHITISAQQHTYAGVIYDSTYQINLQASDLAQSPTNGYAIIGGNVVLHVDSLGMPIFSKKITYLNHDATFYRIIPTVDSNYIVCGSVYDYINATTDGIILKINNTGTILWSKLYNTPATSYTLTSICQTNDSGFVASGIQSVSSSTNKAFILKINAYGVSQWAKGVSVSPFNHTARAVVQLPDSSYALAGIVADVNFNIHTTFITRLDKTGGLMFSKEYASTSNLMSNCDVLIKNNALYIMVVDNFASIIKTDFLGTIIWKKTITEFGTYSSNMSYYSFYTRFHSSKDGGFYANDYHSSFGLVWKTDSVGTLKTSISGNGAPGIGVLQTKDLGFFIIGNGPFIGARMQNGPNTIPQIGMIKTDSNLIPPAAGCLYNPGLYTGLDSIISSNIITNTITKDSIVQIIPSLQVTSIVLAHTTGCIGASGSISRNNFNNTITLYPNPANTFLNVELEKQNKSEIKIYDVLGNLVLTSGATQIDVSSLVNGVYFVKVANSAQKFIKQ